MREFHILFDIDGVLNRTPQLGSIPPHIIGPLLDNLHDLYTRLVNINLKKKDIQVVRLVCSSFHRHNQPVKDAILPKLYATADTIGNGNKDDAIEQWIHDRAAMDCQFLVIDDQYLGFRQRHDTNVFFYQVDGSQGLTSRDIRNIMGAIE